VRFARFQVSLDHAPYMYAIYGVLSITIQPRAGEHACNPRGCIGCGPDEAMDQPSSFKDNCDKTVRRQVVQNAIHYGMVLAIPLALAIHVFPRWDNAGHLCLQAARYPRPARRSWLRGVTLWTYRHGMSICGEWPGIRTISWISEDFRVKSGPMNPPAWPASACRAGSERGTANREPGTFRRIRIDT